MKYILITVVSGFLLWISFIVIDFVYFEGTKTKDIMYDDECDYKVPKKWRIVSNGKYFAVEYVDEYTGKEYLCDHRGYPTLFYPTIVLPTVFSSECKAKAYLKEYLYRNRNRAKDFN